MAGGIALLAALIVIAVVARPAPPGPTPPPRTAPTSTAPRADVPAACARDVRGEVFSSGTLEDRVGRLTAYARGNPGRPVSLVITDDVLTDGLRRQMVASGGPQLQDPTITVRPDGIGVTGTVSAAFFRFGVSATLVPAVGAGRLAFTVRDLETGGLPRDQVEPALRQASDPASWGLAMAVESVPLRSGCGVLRGTAAVP